jgi:hypothetical protein
MKWKNKRIKLLEFFKSTTKNKFKIKKCFAWLPIEIVITQVSHV